MGSKLFAIPWDRFTVDEVNRRLVLNAEKDVLERAPGFDKDNWPDMSDPSFGSEVYNHYGSQPYWDESSATRRRM